MELYDYTGVIHFHSLYSFDGRVSIEEIIKAAGENGIDFLMLTDHSTLGARKDGLEGWNGGILLVVGQEITPRFNHYLAFDINEELIFNENDIECKPQDYIDRVNALGGIGFIAHPDHEGTEKFHVKHFPWQDWSVYGYTGMGVWDFMTDWQSTLKSLPSALIAYLFPAYVLKGPRDKTLERWDHLNKESRVVGIGELDNHDTPRKILGITVGVFPFKRAFRFTRTHLLLDKPLKGKTEEDIKALLNALANGRAYIAMEYFRDAKGFSFSLSDFNREVTMGDEFSLKGEALLNVKIPEKGKIRIIHDSRLFAETIDKDITCKILQRGIYRAEVYLKVRGKYRPWIFSNPVYVR
jgi:hypothetical protein